MASHATKTKHAKKKMKLNDSGGQHQIEGLTNAEGVGTIWRDSKLLYGKAG
jgi:hypothetical protein